MKQDISQEPEHEGQHRHCNVESRSIFCHDNLEVLQGINSECIDLIYLDPPFNKKKVFSAPIGSSAEGASFKDTFAQEDLKDEWGLTIKEDHYSIHEFLNAVKNIEGRTSYNFCYLVYMAIRLIECRRVLKDTGSICLHCDPTMSHYLKLLMDCIFGEKKFRNEIIWCYYGPGSPRMRQFNRKTDTILWYVKGHSWTFNANSVRMPYKDGEPHLGGYGIDKKVASEYGARGKVPENWWIISIAPRSKTEYVGYPTQKPLALLERIIKASSNRGDMVLDPFCGCATTCVAAERLGRRWIGVDISHKAYELVQKRIDADEIHYHTDPPTRMDGTQETQEGKYVYVISHKKWKGEYKVGIASNYDNRLKSYQASDPNREYQLEHYKLTPHYREVERHIYDVFSNKHEWVQGDLKDIIAEIEKHDPAGE